VCAKRASKLRPETLAALVEPLRADSPIDVLERIEHKLKELLKRELAAPLDGRRMRELASFQQELGFLLKYKSYAVKAASPLGYSVFLQRRGEGFSFQRHVTHKTEIFYILDVPPGGYVFLCDFEEWQRLYERDAFLAWLGGTPDARYERFRFVPQPGDVIVIDRLNVVHSVIGCTLAEFATVSTDMVDRLHDQNEHHKIPAQFTRGFADDRLRNLVWPAESHLVTIGHEGCSRSRIPEHSVKGGVRTVFGEGVVAASAFRFEVGATSDLSVDPERAACLHVTAGAGRLVLGDAAEARRPTPPTLAARSGDLFFLAPGAHYGFVNDGATPLTIAEHRIPPAVAFI
jgi:mannose-6-phosphate isomerase-like protein (cupin superfamily)